ncbi:gfo/Idh/MocA family oxidoreductase [candidate division KSB1 bacterium]|nr:gfo/Idh/MocA family oxidoreductase [candidate division KSB1 bacterium]
MKNKSNITRREFIAGFSAFAASLPWISLIGTGESSAQNPSDRVRLGIIGTGSRGRVLMLHLQQIPNCEITAICDNYPPNLYEGKRITSGKAWQTGDYRRLLELDHLDGVIIATPLHLHAQMTVDALQSGKHVFCEKSMALTYEDCKKMVHVHRESGKNLQIGFQRLFDLRYIDAVERVKRGDIGPITMIRAYWHRNNDWRRPLPRPELERKINWRLYREYSGGLMTELGAHQIQVANWLLESHPLTVTGVGSINYWNDGREVFDNVSTIFSYPGDVQCIYDSVTSNRFYGLEEQIMGPKGTLELEHGKIYSENPPPAPGILQLINNIENSVFDTIPIGGASWVPETALEYEGNYLINKRHIPDSTLLEMEAFVNSIRNQSQIEGIVEQAYYASVAVLVANESMQERKIVHWSEDLNI